MTVLLPDLSEFQRGADMPGIRRVNGGAAIIRAAYGAHHPDHAFPHLRAATLGYTFLGLYQYLVADQDVISQARAFCDLIGTLSPHEVPILDLEEGTGNQADRAASWLAHVGGKLGKVPWLYSGLSFAETHGLAPIFSSPNIHTWVAAYGSVEPSLGHTLWQSTDGRIGAHITDWPGAGRCDTSIYHGTLTELAALIAPPETHPGGKVAEHVTEGKLSLAGLCKQHGHDATPAGVLRLTAEHSPHRVFPENVAEWVNDVFRGVRDAQATIPPDLHLYLPA